MIDDFDWFKIIVEIIDYKNKEYNNQYQEYSFQIHFKLHVITFKEFINKNLFIRIYFSKIKEKKKAKGFPIS